MDTKNILMIEFFINKVFEDVNHAANRLIHLGGQTGLESFAPAYRPAFDNYASVTTHGPTTNKAKIVDVDTYLKRFRTDSARFCFAKSVAASTHHNMKYDFMREFNDLEYHELGLNQLGSPLTNTVLHHRRNDNYARSAEMKDLTRLPRRSCEVAKDPLPLLKSPTRRVGERNDQSSHHAIRLKINDGSQVA